jgi:hypothetical protein
MTMKKTLWILFAILILSLIFAVLSSLYRAQIVIAPPVMNNSLQDTNSPTPTLGIEPLPAFSKNKDAQIDRPTATEEIMNGYVVRGKATGAWLFEGNTELRLETTKGALISSQLAKVVEGADWMTSDLVPWTATIEFSTTSKALATLTAEQKKQGIDARIVFVKSNASGDPERDETLVQTVRLKIDTGELLPL